MPKPTATPLVAVLLQKPVAAYIGILIMCLLALMMPGGGAPGMGGRDFNYRIPPAWSPETENSYSFRAYLTDISLWTLLTDLQPHQQCVAIIMRLGGAAKEMARMMTPNEMVNGGMRNGILVDPVTYLLGALHARFSALEEESRLTTMTEMLSFIRSQAKLSMHCWQGTRQSDSEQLSKDNSK